VRWPAILLGCGALGLLAGPSAGLVPGEDPPVDFDRDVRPILAGNCFPCHGPDAGARQADLRLDTREGATAPREHGRALDPDQPQASLLLERIRSADPARLMPPPESGLALDDEQRARLERWTAAGAPYAEHWAFVPPRRVALTGSRNPIDELVARGIERAGLVPAPEAAPATLLRRVTLDLVGLPPSPEEQAAFLADPSRAAWEELVERLLASPAHGERMAWDWLDAARYADSNGYQGDADRTMWPWRDWVVRAFARNLSFDQFTVEQLAGDLLPEAGFEQRLATGFLRNHPINGEGGRIEEENRVEYVMDMTETTGTVWLGLTLNCCRCHDHKFDPIRQREYYGLSAYFNQTPVDGSGGDPQTPPLLAAPSAEQSAQLARLDARLAELDRALAEREAELACPFDERRVALVAEREAQLEARRALEARVPRVMVMADRDERRPTYVLAKGTYSQRGEEVDAGTPACLPPLPAGAPANRLALARWIVSDENPLAARVAVNRIWQQLFGVGLVKTSEDFGAQGERPPQQELLDWLAVDLRESGWDVRALLRRIVTSDTYRRSSAAVACAGGSSYELDPENRWLARGPRFRMPSWMLRDQALAASGLLVRRAGGPPVLPLQPGGIWEEASFGTKTYRPGTGEDLHRRSLYTFWRRIVAPPAFFDNAGRQVSCVRPLRTNSPLHALYTLNDATFVECARALAERALSAGGAARERLDRIFVRVLARGASEAEAALFLELAEASRIAYGEDPTAARELLAVGEAPRDESLDPAEHAAWTELALAVLNLDEALTKE